MKLLTPGAAQVFFSKKKKTKKIIRKEKKEKKRTVKFSQLYLPFSNAAYASRSDRRVSYNTVNDRFSESQIFQTCPIIQTP